jgi:hypothetical protein
MFLKELLTKSCVVVSEHVTLPRHFVGENSGGSALRRAEPGEKENETELYNPCGTSEANLVEWGIGVDLYFSSVRMICFMFFIAGMMNISSIYYYASGEYSGDESRGFAVEGSAICTQTYWAICENW